MQYHPEKVLDMDLMYQSLPKRLKQKMPNGLPSYAVLSSSEIKNLKKQQ